MSIVKIKGVIKYKIKRNHPDLNYIPIDKRDDTFEFEDTYHIDTDKFWGKDHIEAFIKHDLSLVAGGGYDTDTIKNVKFDLLYV